MAEALAGEAPSLKVPGLRKKQKIKEQMFAKTGI
jgi:hypothetical protein